MLCVRIFLFLKFPLFRVFLILCRPVFACPSKCNGECYLIDFFVRDFDLGFGIFLWLFFAVEYLNTCEQVVLCVRILRVFKMPVF